MAENSDMSYCTFDRLRQWPLPLLLIATLGLGGCDALGLETPGKLAAKKEADGRAIGSACRHALRSIEDCHGSNPKVSKSAIFEGWREMDVYMRENNIPGIPSPPPPPPTPVDPGEELVSAGKDAPEKTGSSAEKPKKTAGETAP